MNIQLGRKYVDRITGFKGVAIGYVNYLSGCNQALLVPPVGTNGAYVDSHWFDVQRLAEDTTDDSVIVLDNVETPGCDKEAPKR
jgi:hypothetical protein